MGGDGRSARRAALPSLILALMEPLVTLRLGLGLLGLGLGLGSGSGLGLG